MREIWFSLVVMLALTGALPAAAQPAKPGGAGDLLAVTPQDRVLGKPDAPITIIEYASFTCPHCAHFANEVLPQLKEKWIDTGKAKLVLRDFPLDQTALQAEVVARCAPPDRYFGLAETFFASQDKWAISTDPRAGIERIALLGGMSKKQVETCLSDKKVEDEVATSRLIAAQQLGVDSTPTFFVNGKKFEGAPTIEAFNELLSGLAEKS